jgi:hypothetical protein
MIRLHGEPINFFIDLGEQRCGAAERGTCDIA